MGKMCQSVQIIVKVASGMCRVVCFGLILGYK